MIRHLIFSTFLTSHFSINYARVANQSSVEISLPLTEMMSLSYMCSEHQSVNCKQAGSVNSASSELCLKEIMLLTEKKWSSISSRWVFRYDHAFLYEGVSVHPSVCLSVCPSVHPSIQPSIQSPMMVGWLWWGDGQTDRQTDRQMDRLSEWVMDRWIACWPNTTFRDTG